MVVKIRLECYSQNQNMIPLGDFAAAEEVPKNLVCSGVVPPRTRVRSESKVSVARDLEAAADFLEPSHLHLFGDAGGTSSS